MRCEFGGHAISGRYLQYPNGVLVCERHAAGAPRCMRCGIPSSSLKDLGGVAACSECEGEIPRCVLCGRRTLAASSLSDRPDRMYCAACLRSGEACDFCGHPASGGRRFKDGRRACADCARQVVLDPDKVKNLFWQVREAVAEQCRLELPKPVALEVATPAEMAKRAGMVFSPTDGMDSRALGIFTFDGRNRAIRVELGLPRPSLITTMAHEFGHAWQSKFCLTPAIPMLAEGFSEWTAHRIAMKAKFREEARRIERRGDVYGQGFRVVMGLVRKAGVSEMLKVVEDRLRRGVYSST